MPRVIVSVTNDLTTDNRVDKVCRTLVDIGFEVVLVGRLLPDSAPLGRNYPTKRMKLWFRKGPLFYLEYNIRLFLFLLFSKVDIYHANDLDTLLANGLASIIRRKKLIYDSHEYFTEVPEVVHRKLVQKSWEAIERMFFKRPLAIFTVNQSIANLYEKKYDRKLHVMRNIPERAGQVRASTRAEFGLPEDKFILILQGAGINMHRGAEEMMDAFALLDDSFFWVIVGNGDVVPYLKEKAAQLQLNDRMLFLPRMPYAEMIRYTQIADLGLTLDRPTNINYLYSLPNKIFDYIRAGIPVFASDLPEVTNIISTYQVGWTFPNHNATIMADLMKRIKADKADFQLKRANTTIAAGELCWENEVEALVKVYSRFVP